LESSILEGQNISLDPVVLGGREPKELNVCPCMCSAEAAVALEQLQEVRSRVDFLADQPLVVQGGTVAVTHAPERVLALLQPPISIALDLEQTKGNATDLRRNINEVFGEYLPRHTSCM